jgi:type II secretory pathway pseudopilin PulG
MKFSHEINKGFGLVEVVIGVAIISIAVLAIMGVFQKALILTSSTTRSTQAAFLAEEGIEAVKILRDTSWDDNIDILSEGTDYYLSFSTTTGWSAGTEVVVIDGIFYRSFQIEDVYRNAITDDIEGAGTEDPDTKKITVSVSWYERNSTTTRLISTYITNIFGN